MASTIPPPNTLGRLATPYGSLTIDKKMQKCLMLLANIWELKNDAGATDYTTQAGMKQLAIDAQAALNGVAQKDLPAVTVGVAWGVANAISGAPVLLADKVRAAAYLANMSDDLLDRMNLLVEYFKQQATGD